MSLIFYTSRKKRLSSVYCFICHFPLCVNRTSSSLVWSIRLFITNVNNMTIVNKMLNHEYIISKVCLNRDAHPIRRYPCELTRILPASSSFSRLLRLSDDLLYFSTHMRYTEEWSANSTDTIHSQAFVHSITQYEGHTTSRYR